MYLGAVWRSFYRSVFYFYEGGDLQAFQCLKGMEIMFEGHGNMLEGHGNMFEGQGNMFEGLGFLPFEHRGFV